jgi:hypothetical protein
LSVCHSRAVVSTHDTEPSPVRQMTGVAPWSPLDSISRGDDFVPGGDDEYS